MGVAIRTPKGTLSDNPVLLDMKRQRNVIEEQIEREAEEELRSINSRLLGYLMRMEKLVDKLETSSTLKAVHTAVSFTKDCPEVDIYDRTRVCSFAQHMVILYEGGFDDSHMTRNRHSCMQHFAKELETRHGFSLNIMKIHYLADINQLSGKDLIMNNPEMIEILTDIYRFSGFIINKSKNWNKKTVSYTISGGYEPKKVVCVLVPERTQNEATQMVASARKFFKLLHDEKLLRTVTHEKRFLRFRLLQRNPNKNNPNPKYYLGMGRFKLDIGQLA